MYQVYYVNTQRRKIAKPISFNVKFYSCLGGIYEFIAYNIWHDLKIDRIKWDVCCTFMFPIKRNLIKRSINFKDGILNQSRNICKKYLKFLKIKNTKSVKILNTSIPTIWYVWFFDKVASYFHVFLRKTDVE